MSLQDIIIAHQSGQNKKADIPVSFNENDTMSDVTDSTFKNTYQVLQANRYEEPGDLKTMQVQIFDVLFDNEVCSLVYMQDLT